MKETGKRLVKASVVVATYNHEKYIAKTLESIVMQECTFDYEVLVGDDASKDKTGAIVNEYAQKYPDKIRAFLRKKNLGAFRNIHNLVKSAKGEYIAFVEGDDYWLDDRKLQKQIDFLENNPDFAACFGRCIVVDENDERQKDFEKYMPFFSKEEYTSQDLEDYYLPGQTATAVYRTESLHNLEKLAKKDKRVIPRCPMVDIFLVLAILSQGRIKTMDEVLSAYRYVLRKGSGSWSSKHDGFSLINVIFFLYGMKELERVGKLLGINICYDERRKSEFAKVAMYKGQMPIIAIQIIRFFIWLWYQNKKDFYRFIRDRHR
ncbi:glycosyltransferase [Butyrivibrio sp. AC2005]|uniref:glycosyltransferase n=1 Tax=Butyrivibrio sp. AC2005 TaxID=1280672 RepID=UPI0006782997|nr:glycosyltransferase [Butyrivibrio sp. AC2005]